MTDDELDELIEEATVDTYDEYEERAGFHATLGDKLVFPFPAKMMGEEIIVSGLDMKDEQRILAVCSRDGQEYRVDMLDLEIDGNSVKGSEWIAAYRRWGSYT